MSYQRWISSLFLTCAWLYFIRTSMAWFAGGIDHHFDFIHLLLIVFILFAWYRKSRNKELESSELNHAVPKPWFWLALGVVGVCYFLLVTLVDIHLFSFIFAIAGLYLISALWLSPRSWRSAMIPVLLLLLTLPFGRHLDIFIGFPLRRLAADMVLNQLSSAGFHVGGSDTILVIENRAAHVSTDCSGIKGLWAAFVFFLTWSWIEGFRLSMRWLLLILILVLSVFAANLLRITLLVYLDSVFGLHDLASIIHYPLGAIGLVASCALVYGVSRRWEIPVYKVSGSSDPVLPAKGIRWIPWAYGVMVLCLGLLIRNEARVVKRGIFNPVISGLSAEFISLSEKEQQLFDRGGASACKFRFLSGKTGGSAIIVIDNDWRYQHKPEVCLEAAGMQIISAATILAADDFPLRKFNGKDYQAFSWFQSPSGITDDFSLRCWKHISGKEKNWAMCTVVFNNNANTQEIQTIFVQLRKYISSSLSFPYEQTSQK